VTAHSPFLIRKKVKRAAILPSLENYCSLFMVIASESQPTSSVTFSMLSKENKVLDSKNKIVDWHGE